MTRTPTATPLCTRRQALWLGGALALPPAVRAQAPGADFWRLLREGGCAVLMRHAQTEPGVGDPPGFTLGQCRTQRNLSAEGREQSRRVGQAFQRAGIAFEAVRSSAWCRCTDTAQLAFGRADVWPALNSFFQGQGDGAAQTRTVLQALATLRAPANWMLVTHQVNISALTGEFPSMGELFLVRPGPAPDGRLRVQARLLP